MISLSTHALENSAKVMGKTGFCMHDKALISVVPAHILRITLAQQTEFGGMCQYIKIDSIARSRCPESSGLTLLLRDVTIELYLPLLPQNPKARGINHHDKLYRR